jgi:hypothetical protein
VLQEPRSGFIGTAAAWNIFEFPFDLIDSGPSGLMSQRRGSADSSRSAVID